MNDGNDWNLLFINESKLFYINPFGTTLDEIKQAEKNWTKICSPTSYF